MDEDKDVNRSEGLDPRQWDSVYQLVHEALRERAAQADGPDVGLADVRAADDGKDVADERDSGSLVRENRR